MWRMTPAPVRSARTFVSPAPTRQASWLRPVVSQLETRREWPSRRRERWSSIVRVSLALPKGCELLSSDVRCRQPGAIGPRFADARHSSSHRHPEAQIEWNRSAHTLVSRHAAVEQEEDTMEPERASGRGGAIVLLLLIAALAFGARPSPSPG